MSARLKICGVTRVEDFVACRELGVDAVGINLWSGSRRGLLLDEAAALLAAAGPRGAMQVVLVVVDPPAGFLPAARARLRPDLVQLHGARAAAVDAAEAAPWIRVLRGTPDLEALEDVRPAPTWILVDSDVPGFGGEGRRADWDYAARAVSRLAPLPVWLAGGIGPDDAERALRRVAPAGLDVASGAERPGAQRGEKDPERIAALVSACKS